MDSSIKAHNVLPPYPASAYFNESLSTISLASRNVFLATSLDTTHTGTSIAYKKLCHSPYSKRHGVFCGALRHAADYHNLLPEIIKSFDGVQSAATQRSFCAYSSILSDRSERRTIALLRIICWFYLLGGFDGRNVHGNGIPHEME